MAILRKRIPDIPLMFLLRVRIPIYGIVRATPITDPVCCSPAPALFLRFLKKARPSADPDRRLNASVLLDSIPLFS